MLVSNLPGPADFFLTLLICVVFMAFFVDVGDGE